MNSLPFGQELSNLRDQVNRALEETFSTGTQPAVDIYETSESLVLITSPLLGLDTASLDISITEGAQIVISGETHPPTDIPTEHYLRRERKFGKFSRSLALPVAVQADQAKASYKNQVLTITIPKVAISTKVVKITPVD